jgi:hypothetical protein
MTFFISDIFQYTPNLRHLTLSVDFLSDLLELLPLLPGSKYWESITFTYFAGHVPWSALDAAMAEPRFRTLRRFAFDHCVDGGRAPLSTETKALMPLALARGILE